MATPNPRLASDSAFTLRQYSRQDGSFNLGVPPCTTSGTFMVVAALPDGSSWVGDMEGAKSLRIQLAPGRLRRVTFVGPAGPLADVQLHLVDQASIALGRTTITTDGQGRCLLRWSENCVPVVRSDDERLMAHYEGVPISKASDDGFDVTVRLKAAASIEGRVFDRFTGQPLVGVTLGAMEACDGTGYPVIVETRTGSDGRYKITGLRQYEYGICVSRIIRGSWECLANIGAWIKEGEHAKIDFALTNAVIRP